MGVFQPHGGCGFELAVNSCPGCFYPWCVGAEGAFTHGALVPGVLLPMVRWCRGCLYPWCVVPGVLLPMVRWCPGCFYPWCVGARGAFTHGALVPGVLLPRKFLFMVCGALFFLKNRAFLNPADEIQNQKDPKHVSTPCRHPALTRNQWLFVAAGLLGLRLLGLVLGQSIPTLGHWAMFYGGSLLLTVGVVLQTGQHGLFSPLFRQPLRGVGQGFSLFALLLLAGWALLYIPWLQPWWPHWMLDLLDAFDPWPSWNMLQQNQPWFITNGWLAGLGGGIEEWLFRGLLFWGWLTPAQRSQPSWQKLKQCQNLGLCGAVLGKALLVSTFFALLHVPAPGTQLLSAFLGGMALSWLLWWKQSLLRVAVLHGLFNWKIFL